MTPTNDNFLQNSQFVVSGSRPAATTQMAGPLPIAGRLTIAWLLCVGISAIACGEPVEKRFEFKQTEMAIPIQIVLYSADNATAESAAAAGFSRFHELNAILSDYDPESELRRLGDTSGGGVAVRVSDDLWRVLVRAVELSKRSDGAFDVTISPVVHLWRNARQTKELPSPEAIQKALSRVGYRMIRLDKEHQSVELLRPNMRLDLGGIAKGYAVDEAMAAIRKHGITRMLVNAGGNVGLGDAPPDKPGWRIGVAPPTIQSPPRQYLWLSRVALSTSGDMWQHTLIDGVRYSHLVNPRTGMALTDRSSVTVVGANGLGTDGLSSAVAILGPEEGLKLIENTPGAAAFIVRVADGKEQIYQSSRWKDLSRAGD
jgi:FAD:protein FMN transferase